MTAWRIKGAKMSERGSFVTEYVYCDKCFEACKKVLCTTEKFLHCVVLPSWEKRKTLPIIAGKIGGLHQGHELEIMQFELKPKLDRLLCHPVRIAVLADSGKSKIFICGE